MKRLAMLLALAGCNVETKTTYKQPMLCAVVANAYFPVRRCEFEDFTCFTQGEGIACIAKQVTK